MRKAILNIYQFKELGEDAKQKALNNMREGNEFSWSDDYIESIKRAVKHFDFNLIDYSIDWDNINRSSYEIRSTHKLDDIENLSGPRLYKYLQNNLIINKKGKNNPLLIGECPFTGFCSDENFLDEIREFVKKPTNITFKELIENCVYNTINAGCKDWEHMQSDEAIIENIDANGYEFTEDGEMYIESSNTVKA